MSPRRVLIAGSADGLGLMAARNLIADGHKVTLHARNPRRAQQAMDAVPEAANALHGDLASLQQTRALAERGNQQPPFDAIIHNARVGYREPRRTVTEDGLEHVFQINVRAPYLLTATIARPGRLIYLSSACTAPATRPGGSARRPWPGRRHPELAGGQRRSPAAAPSTTGARNRRIRPSMTKRSRSACSRRAPH